MEPPVSSDFPDRMNSFMTTEHFTLQAARGIINSEIMSRVSIYFMTLSSVLIATAFLAQAPAMDELFVLFLAIGFPVVLLLGFFTLARLMILSGMDAVYIRAINRVRHFYVQAAPEARAFLLFPPYDDDQSVLKYGGYEFSFWSGMLSAPNAVGVTNSIAATVLVSALLIDRLQMSVASFLPFSLAILVGVAIAHTALALRIARSSVQEEYRSVKFAAPDESRPDAGT